MGFRMEMQVLLAASVFAALSATLWRYFTTAYIEDSSYKELGVLGFAALLSMLVSVMCLDMWRLKPANSHTLTTLLSQYMGMVLLRVMQPYTSWYLHKQTMNPKKVNEDALLYILKVSRNTEYGKKYKFREMKSREDFVRMHPLTTQEHYRAYMERIAAGEKDVLFAGEPLALVSTSGTTGQPKVYAFTNEYVKAVQHQIMALVFYTVIQFMNLQRIAQFHICSKMNKTDGGMTIGAGSQLLVKFFPFNLIPKAYQRLYAEDASYYAQAVFSLADRELRFINGFSADLMFSYWKFMTENWEHLCDDISNGEIGPHIKMPDGVRKELSAKLQKDTARAAELRTAMQSGVVGLAKRVWPDMEFVIMGKSAAFKMCANNLMENHLKGVKVINLFHGATEGITGLNFDLKEPHIGESLTLLPYPCFIEFIPLEDVEKENPLTVFPEQLELGRLYEVVHTSLSGLYRCRYGDIIKVVGFHNKTPKYEFMYKLGQRLNIAYERTPDKFLYEAIKECLQYLPPGVNLVDYTTTESIAMENLTGPLGKGHYVFFMELDTEEPINCWKPAYEIEQALLRLYQPYKRFKDMDSIGPLRIIQVKRGTFDGLKDYIWNKTPHGQFKMPRVLRREPALKYLIENEVGK